MIAAVTARFVDKDMKLEIELSRCYFVWSRRRPREHGRVDDRFHTFRNYRVIYRWRYDYIGDTEYKYRRVVYMHTRTQKDRPPCVR